MREARVCLKVSSHQVYNRIHCLYILPLNKDVVARGQEGETEAGGNSAEIGWCVNILMTSSTVSRQDGQLGPAGIEKIIPKRNSREPSGR